VRDLRVVRGGRLACAAAGDLVVVASPGCLIARAGERRLESERACRRRRDSRRRRLSPTLTKARRPLDLARPDSDVAPEHPDYDRGRALDVRGTVLREEMAAPGEQDRSRMEGPGL